MENTPPLSWRTKTNQSKLVVLSGCAGGLLPGALSSCTALVFSSAALMLAGFDDNEMNELNAPL